SAQSVAPSPGRPALAPRASRPNGGAVHRHSPVHPLSLDGTEPCGRPAARSSRTDVRRVQDRRLLERNPSMKSLFALAGLSAAALARGACGRPARKRPHAAAVPATVTVARAGCPPTRNGAKAAGCYVTLTAGSDDRLGSVSTPLADTAQIHE